MGDSLMTIVAILLAAVLMFVFPLMSMSDRSDDISQLTVKTATTEFVDNVRTTGRLSLDNYSAFEQEIAATGNTYDIEMEVKVLDENPGKKTTQAEATKIGENLYYNKYTTQVEEELYSKGRITLKEGDLITVTARNTNLTISQMLRNFFYSLSGDDTYQIAASHSGVVMSTGR